jgi:uncharacterized protein YecT (DUF1311 family)
MSACAVQSLNARILDLTKVLDQASSEKVAVTARPAPKETVTTRTAECVNVGAAIDRAICSDATLKHWEERMGSLFQQALADPSVRTLLVEDQRRWVGERSSNCATQSSTKLSDCMLQMIKRRMEQFVQIINSRDGVQEDRPSRVEKILAGKTETPPGLDADTIDRESTRAEQSELIIGDARTCVRNNFGVAASAAAADQKKVVALLSEVCFADFSRRLSALELGQLAKPSFEMLVSEELKASK